MTDYNTHHLNQHLTQLDKQEKAEALYSQLERELEKLLENNGMSCILRHLCGSDLWVKALTTGLKTSAALAIDNGRVRSTHDQLRIGGIGQLNNTGASILKMLATKGAAEVPNIYKLQSYYEKYSDMIIFGQSLAKGSVKKITSAPICSALAVCAHHTSEEKVMRFMEILKTGIPPEPVQKNDFMVIRFRNHLLTAKGVDSHGSASRKKLMMKVMRVYKAYVKDEDLNKFLEQSDFAYPIPE